MVGGWSNPFIIKFIWLPVVFQVDISLGSSKMEFSLSCWNVPWTIFILFWVPVDTKGSFSLFSVILGSFNIMINTEIWNRVSHWVFWSLVKWVLDLDASSTSADWIIFQMDISLGSSKMEFSLSGWNVPRAIFILFWVPVNTKGSFSLFSVILGSFNIMINTKIWNRVSHWVFWSLIEWVLDLNTASRSTDWIILDM